MIHPKCTDRVILTKMLDEPDIFNRKWGGSRQLMEGTLAYALYFCLQVLFRHTGTEHN